VRRTRQSTHINREGEPTQRLALGLARTPPPPRGNPPRARDGATTAPRVEFKGERGGASPVRSRTSIVLCESNATGYEFKSDTHERGATQNKR